VLNSDKRPETSMDTLGCVIPSFLATSAWESPLFLMRVLT